MSKKYGFTLVELMVALVIIGILAALAVPTYNAYVRRARTAEAYVGIDAMTKAQIKNYINNKRFQQATNPSRVPYTKLAINDNTPWTNMGKPIAPGVMTTFEYEARAGKNDGSGAPILVNDYTNGNTQLGNFSSWALMENPNGGFCGEVTNVANQTNTIMESPLGKPFYAWTLITATADIKKAPDSGAGRYVCTAFARLVDTDSNGKVRTGPIMSKNVGE
ncbi:MAG: prepilin-type N-terminal cleavage/methylation domain-containing protein [Bdellovibrionota bacterium]